MLNQDSHESLDGSEDSSMDHDWSGKTWFEWLFLPLEIVVVILVLWEELGGKLNILGQLGVLSLDLGFGLVLKVESDRKLEIKLDGSALMRSLESVIDLDVNLWHDGHHRPGRCRG